MKSVLALVAIAGLALACGRSGSGATTAGLAGGPPEPAGSTPALTPSSVDSPQLPPVATPACAGGIALMLRGADATGTGDRAIEVGPMTVKAGGSDVTVRDGRAGLLDVTRDHAYTLGMVVVPEEVGRVDVTVPVLGGRVGGAEADGCTGPLTFRFDRAKVDATRCHVVVQLDPGSFASLATAAEPVPVIVPAFTVRY